MKAVLIIMTKNAFSFVLLLLIGLFTVGCGTQSNSTSITFSHILSDRSEWHVGAVEWKKRVEEKLGDQVSIRLVTNSSLSGNNQRTELEMVQTGTLGGSWESSILLTNVDRRWTVWSMPWLFDSYEEAERICESELGEDMLAMLEEKNIIGLAYGFNGFRRLTNSKRPVSQLADMEHLKIRIPSQQMYVTLFQAWGADPSQMNFGDLIIALREGAMDGQENPLHVIESTGLYEIQNYLTLWEYSFDPIIFCLSKTAWDRLTPDQQKVIRQAAKEAAAIQRQTVIDNEKQHLETLKQNGMKVTVPPPAAVEEFRQASQTVYDEYCPVIGDELLDRFIQAAEAS